MPETKYATPREFALAGCLLMHRADVRRSSWFPLLSLLSGLAGACSTEVGAESIPQGDGIDAYIESLPYLPVEPAAGRSRARRRRRSATATTRARRENLKETRQYDRIVAYAANSDSLWPGALVSADSVLTGLFTQIVLPRAPATISVSLENLGGTQDRRRSRSRACRRIATRSPAILDAEITGSTPANLYSEIEQVHSEEQLNMALGVQASWGLGVASLKSSFDFSNKQIRSRYLVRYTQAYYTVDLDAPAVAERAVRRRASRSTTSRRRWTRRARPSTSRRSPTAAWCCSRSSREYSAEEMGAALEFAYSGGVDVSGDVSVTYKDIISQEQDHRVHPRRRRRRPRSRRSTATRR